MTPAPTRCTRPAWFLLLLILVLPAVTFAQTGSIAGTVVDEETGETLIGANVRVVNTTLGAVSDIDGRYEIRGLAAGTYSLLFTYIGYADKTVTGIKVTAGATVRIDIEMGLSEDEALEEIVVEARALRNNEASLLAERQRALTVSDAISAETISRSGSSNVADAMQRVTGAAVTGGRYVSVRGLGDRYTTTQLNGTELPSADPDRRSFQLDLIPANLLDNVVTQKTFTPDKPGNFSGGAVDVTTKDYPDGRLFQVSASGAYNSLATGRSGFLTYRGSSTDLLGFDDGARALPGAFRSRPQIPTFQEARTDPAKAQELDRLSRAFSPQMAPSTGTARPNASLSASAGNVFSLGAARKLGVLGSLTYSYNASLYNDGQENRYYLAGSSTTAEALASGQTLRDTRGAQEATWGAYSTATLQLSRNHEVGLRLVGTQSAESQARYLAGRWPQELPSDEEFFESRTLTFAERSLRSAQLRGQHAFGRRADVRLDWRASLARTTQDEPDLRFFSNDYRVAEGDTTYNINRALYDEPSRFFRDLREDAATADVALSVPMRRYTGLNGTFKAGLFYQGTDRRFREQRYAFTFVSQQVGCEPFRYEGDAGSFFSEQGVGIVGQTASGRPCLGNYIEDRTDTRNSYDGTGRIGAAFVMADAVVAPRLRAVGGVRLETTTMDVASLDTTVAPGALANRDLLPALGLIYEVFQSANVRLSYGRTLARPTFREFGPFASFDFIGDYLYEGNPTLQRTLIDNLDARFEWFARPGDLYAVSAFAKRLQNPIERVFDVGARRFTNRNVPEGRVYGLELEARRAFALGGSKRLQPGLNVSLIHSEVDVDPAEAALIRQDDPNAETRRPLFGQSPYLVNGELTYTDAARSASLFYNVFGARLSEVVYGPTPDAYEQPRHSLDFSFSQRLGRATVRAQAKNLLGSRERDVITYRGRDYVYKDRALGRTLSLGVSLRL
ncbi:MAG TPA: TonB-dependent receptor [Rhodothermales bacterium]|nr:TonB-dependent receptor [Rhodothermales bacterium]